MKRAAWIILAVGAVLAVALGALAARRGGGDWWTDGAGLRERAGRMDPRRVLWQPPVPIHPPAGSQQYEPRVTSDESRLFLVRGLPGGNADLYECTRLPAGGWSPPSPIAEINTPSDELGPVASPDGRYLYFYSDRAGGLGGYDLWRAERGPDAWGTPINLGSSVNSVDNEYGPAIGPDGSLWFSSNRARGAKHAPSPAWPATIREPRARLDYDLFVAAPEGEGFAPAERVAVLCTQADEGAPAWSPAGDFLYFASDRPGSEGFDLYRVRMARGVFGPVEPLGPGVNTPFNDLDPALSAEGFRLTFSSDRPAPGAEVAPGSDRTYSLWSTSSREVFPESEPGRWASLAEVWSALWPWLLLLLLLAALAGLARLLARGSLEAAARRLSLLAKCILVSMLIHLAVASLLALWKVGGVMRDLLAPPGGGTRVVLGSAGAGEGVEGLLLGEVTDESGGAPAGAIPELTPVALSASPAPRPGLLLDTPDLPTQAQPGPAPGLPPDTQVSTIATPPLAASAVPAAPPPAAFSPEADAAPAVGGSGMAPLAAAPLSRPESPAPRSVDSQAGPLTLSPAPASAPRSAGETATEVVASPLATLARGPAAGSPSPAREESADVSAVAPGRGAAEGAPSAMTGLSPSDVVGPAPRIAGSEPVLDSPAGSAIAASTAPPTSPSSAPSAGTPAGAIGTGVAPPSPGSGAPLAHETTGQGAPLAHGGPPGASISASAAGLATPGPSARAPDITGMDPALHSALGLSRPAASEPFTATGPAPGAGIPAPSVGSGVAAPASPGPGRALTQEIAGEGSPLARGGAPSATPSLAITGGGTSPPPLAASPGVPMAPLTPHTGVSAALAPSPGASSPRPVAPAAPGGAPALVARFPSSEPLPEPAERFEQRRPENRAAVLDAGGGNEQTERAVALALEWLARHQAGDGSWGGREFDASCGGCGGLGDFDSPAAMTGLGLLCYLGAGHTHLAQGPYRERVARGLQYLMSRQEPSGDLRRGETMYSQTVATVALCEAYAMTRDPALAEAVRRALAVVLDPGRVDRGTAAGTSVLGWQVMAVESARRAGLAVPDRTFADAARWLDTLDRGSGRYPYRAGEDPNPAMTAEAMFVQQLLGRSRQEGRMARSAALILDTPPSWDKGAPTYYWYYATLALFQHQGRAWEEWNRGLARELTEHQHQQGPRAGSWDPQDRWSRMGGRLYQTAICTLSLEVYYRYRAGGPGPADARTDRPGRDPEAGPGTLTPP